MKRQGMIVTIEQLRTLADDLEKEIKDNLEKYGVSGYGTKFQINIINPQEECSDTWEIEEIISDKKDGKVTLTTDNHLETRSDAEEENTKSVKTADAENYVDTDNLRNPELDSVTPLDGCRKYPQDCSGQANMAKKEDTNKVLPGDSKSKLDGAENKPEAN